ncbi:hypothetical protein [Desulfosediminicola flagellatus]|uniref:hypothetical protein n=1 Tax=Desulfosediminicola flagellatus TaxID=2569541 RepID=UPI0010AC90B9|nr:hypothetical protein [Desulfosediminicola flagellatus]
MKVQLFAWARPIGGRSKLDRLVNKLNPYSDEVEQIIDKMDHTYVTDYFPLSANDSIGDVVSRNQNFWYCHGDFHNDQSRLVPQGKKVFVKGDLSLLNCICKSNNKDGTGTVDVYLLDGVCHQVTNQILYLASPRIIVEGVRGYWLSQLSFGHYGRNQRDFLLHVRYCRYCNKSVNNPVSSKKGSMNNNNYLERLDELLLESIDAGDSKEEMLRKERLFMIDERIGDCVNDNEKEAIIKLMEVADRETEGSHSMLVSKEITVKAYVKSVNKINRQKFSKIAKLIGPSRFEKLFDCTPSQVVDLGDAEIAAKAFAER